MSAHRYWRLYVTTNWGANYVGTASVQLRASQAGANLSVTGSGTASASSTYSGSYPASDAFDANTTTTRWNSVAGGFSSSAGTEWVKWDFGAGLDQDIQHLTLVNSTAETTANIRHAWLQYSDDNSSWTNWIQVTNNSTVSGTTTAYPYVPPVSISIAPTLPMPVTTIVTGDTLNIALPMPQSASYSASRIEVSIPFPDVTFYGPWDISVSLPMPKARAVILNSVLNSYRATMPMVEVGMSFGLVAKATLPMMDVAMSGTTTTMIRVDAALPMVAASATLTKTEGISIAAILPMVASGWRGSGSINATLAMPTAEIGIVNGGTIDVSVNLPMIELESSIESGKVISIAVNLAALVPGPFGRINIEIPMVVATIIGRFVATITFEAYSINLQPSTDAGIYPVTRHTGMPFSGIVRYRGSYYGWGPGGLYLLGGDTDAGQPIPWSWHTAITNFGSRQLKVVRETFLHGRLSPTATAKVSIGEASDVSYAAVIQRGSKAQAHRIKYGRGLKADYWSFGLADVAGSAMEVDSLQHEPEKLSRKV